MKLSIQFSYICISD